MRRVLIGLVSIAVSGLSGPALGQGSWWRSETGEAGREGARAVSRAESRAESRIGAIHRVLADPMDPSVLVVAHRGHHRSLPENSIASIEAAIEAGAHVVEVDLARLGDGSHILMHDRTINRTTDGSGKVADLSLGDLEDVRLMHNARPTGHRVPTLGEAFDAARGRVLLNLDPKGIDIPAAAEVARAAGMLDHCVFKAWWKNVDAAFLEWLDANPEVYFMPICRGEAQVAEAMATRDWPAIEVLVDAPDKPLWSRDAVERMKRAGVRPWINTLWNGRISAGFGDERAVFDPEAVFGPVLDMGWGFVQTDLPVRLSRSVRARGLDPTPVGELTTDTFEAPVVVRTPRPGFDRVLSALRDPSDPSVLVFGHRGHIVSAPENSLAAIDAAVEAGLHGVEVDVRRTADGVYVLMHDETLRRTTNGRGRLDETTLAEVRELILMQGIYPTPHRVPTLLEAFEAARGRVLLDLDPKEVDLPELAFLVRQAGMLDQVIIKQRWSALSAEDVSWFAARPEVLFKPNVASVEELGAALGMGAWFSVDSQVWTAETIALARSAGARPWGGSIGRGRAGFLGDRHVAERGPAAVYDPLIKAGVGVVHSDLPELLLGRVRTADRDPIAWAAAGERVAGERVD